LRNGGGTSRYEVYLFYNLCARGQDAASISHHCANTNVGSNNHFDMKNNLIFLDDKDLDKPIYRIFSFSRLKEIFDTNQLTLVKPKLWDDPFEILYLVHKVR